MLSNWRGRSGEAASPPRGAGLKFMALAASISLMLIGFGAAAASPASAGGDGPYPPNQCAEGFDYKDGQCVKTTTYEPVTPAVSYTGNCGLLADAGEQVTAEFLGYVFDPTDGMCKLPGFPRLDFRAFNRHVVLTCDEANGWYLKEIPKPKLTDAAETDTQKIKMCVKEPTFEYQDPTCKSGDVLYPVAAVANGEPRGPLCYTPDTKPYCEIIEGGQWIWTHQSDAVDASGGRGSGYCFQESTGTYCAASLDGTSFVTALFYLKYGEDPGPPSVTKHDKGDFYTYPSVFNAADIVPVIPNPIDADNPVNPGQNLADGGQAFLDRGCLPEPVVPVTPAGGPTPVKDFCPNLDGVQWENYDCNTPVAVAAAEVAVPAPAEVVPPATVEPVTVPEAATVAAPEAATVPAAVPAGDGSQAPSVPMWALAMIAVGVLGAAGAGKQLVGARK